MEKGGGVGVIEEKEARGYDLIEYFRSTGFRSDLLASMSF